MTTSGQTILQLSRDDIVNASYRKLGVLGSGQTANAQQLIDGTQSLNALVAEFRTLGMSIWARKSYNLVFITGQADYTFGIGQTTNIAYPLRIYQANLEMAPDFQSKIDMNEMSFTDYSMLPSSTGTPVNYTYQPKINLGILSVWPTPDASLTAGTRMQILYQSPFEYFIAAADTPDFPEEWANALIYNNAMLLADENSVPLQKKQWIEKQAASHLATALASGAEEASMFWQPESVGR